MRIAHGIVEILPSNFNKWLPLLSQMLIAEFWSESSQGMEIQLHPSSIYQVEIKIKHGINVNITFYC